ncbi:hypothetical protein HK102_011040 [Quaeritorhiza haematococci]|nr:hypothetical protein HK102_011040 [Quaeritorhiza haematococci]
MLASSQSRQNQVIVVGGGLAGLTSAIEAARAGAKVTLLEKEKSVGGNSAKATSGMNSVFSKAQMQRGIKDTYEAFQTDTLRSGKGRSDKELVDTLVKSSTDALNWIESFGLKLDAISQCGGHSFPRTHREGPRLDGKPAPVGWDIIRTLKDYVLTQLSSASAGEGKGSVEVINNARVVDLIVDEAGDQSRKTVRGVKFDQDGQIVEKIADAVVLATGGFACDFASNDSLIHQHAPHLAALATTNGAWATGDGMKMGNRAGAWLVQVHPTGFVDPSNPTAKTKFLAPESLRGHGGILIDPRTSHRFVNELDTRAAVTKAIFELYTPQESSSKLHPPPNEANALLILSAESVQQVGPGNIGFYKSRGFFKVYDGVEAIAAGEGLDASVLRTEIEEYNGAAKEGKDRFGKTVFPVLMDEKDEFYVCRITPVIHYTMGGLRINKDAQIMSSLSATTSSRQPIAGLYGAGEVTGGVHGGNRLAGNSLLECVVFGKIAGRNAATAGITTG